MSFFARRRVSTVLALVSLAAALAGVPSLALARQSMSFYPGDRSRVAVRAVQKRLARHGRNQFRMAAHPPTHVAHRRAAAAAAVAGDEGAAARAVPGAGFTLQDGVLTYPAPARFQPQNLRHR